MHRRALFVLVLLAMPCGQIARAADLPLRDIVEQGRHMAVTLCARCHAVGLSDTSPLKKATPFRVFSSKWPLESLEESLAEGIVTGHAAMPEFVFTPKQIRALLSYIDQLAPQ